MLAPFLVGLNNTGTVADNDAVADTALVNVIVVAIVAAVVVVAVTVVVVVVVVVVVFVVVFVVVVAVSSLSPSGHSAANRRASSSPERTNRPKHRSSCPFRSSRPATTITAAARVSFSSDR